MYIADSAPQGDVTIHTKYLVTTGPHAGASVNFVTNGMLKVRSDGLIYKMGVKEPQLAPEVSTANATVPFGGGAGNLLATAIPWTNYDSQNSGFNYGETNGLPNPGVPNPVDGTAPFIIDVLNATTVTITALALDGAVLINGVANPVLTAQAAGRVTPGAPGYPGQFIQILGLGTHPTTASYVVGVFTDGSGNVVPAGVAPLYIPNVVDVGLAFSSATPIPVPYGAVQFQVGVNSLGDTYSANSGLITFAGTVITNALPSVVAILGTLSLSYFGDSPTVGAVGSYIWRNPDDPGGSGPTRSISDANGTAIGNSFIFDATFAAGIPGLPGIGNGDIPMLWTALSPESVATGSVPVFASPIITSTLPNGPNPPFSSFNFCLTGQIYFPAPGNYTFVLTNHDDVIWGIGGGVTLVSATTSGSGEGGVAQISDYGQTITVVGGYPLLPKEKYTSGEGGDYARCTVLVNVPAAGIYPIELDGDFWYHSGRIFLIEASPTPLASPTIIPPLPIGVREGTQYRYVYRSTATGATSNPSPESVAETIPVTSNTITSLWSNDPQVDVVDYYRVDSATANFTYVNTGPNDDLGTVPGTNTPVSDSLTDTELGTQLLEFDNYEPFPSIDLPQKGTVNVSGGVITWLTGGAIGGSATGFNPRWLAGTVILIGSPTALPYVLIARPVGNTITIPDVPDASGAAYYIAEPILANQPLPYMWGPTDNINFVHAVGDQLRPGTDYWCKGSNLDAAPDTNQQDVTDPSEPLVNGAIAGGRSILGSIKRFWVIMPNFFNSDVTATGTEGDTWTFQESSIKRGLFIPRCLIVEGGGNTFFRVDDGIEVSPGGAESKSITDETLYPIFSHEGSTPQSVTRSGITILPPDDTQPQLQKFSVVNGFLYWDYVAISGEDSIPCTLVFEIQNMAWVWDLMTPPSTIHAADEGESIQGTLVGCSDGTVRQLSSSGTEVVTGIVLASAIGERGFQHTGELVVEYSSLLPVTLTGVVQDEGNGSYGPNPITLPATGGVITKYFVRPSPNKYKLLSWQWVSTDPALEVFIEGCICYTKSWGSSAAYTPTPMFGGQGGEG
jgi:hypothetical protein